MNIFHILNDTKTYRISLELNETFDLNVALKLKGLLELNTSLELNVALKKVALEMYVVLNGANQEPFAILPVQS